MINDYKGTPISKREKRVTTKDFGVIPFDETNEQKDDPLVDTLAAGFSGESQYARIDGYNAPYYRSFENSYAEIYLRQSVLERLKEVNETLAQVGMELFLYDGYRSIPLQLDIWNFFVDKAQETLENPTQEEKEDFAAQFASDPRRFDLSDSTTWPLHSTGGAIDLTLKRLNVPESVYMGCIFDDPSPESGTHFYEDKLINDPENFTESDRAALINRRILYHTMIEHGFTNFDYEIWHYDFDTQLWALLKNIEENTDKYKAVYKTATLHSVKHSNVVSPEFKKTPDKLYIGRIHLGSWLDNLYFTGSDSDGTGQRFLRILKIVNESSKNFNDPLEYREFAISEFSSGGFQLSKK